jgi:hypothetical protein
MSDQFRLVRFERSKNHKKKYDAIIEDKKTKKTQRVAFGSRQPLYAQYRDSTGLKLYSRLDHGDEERRKNYLARHEKTRHKKFSASWLSAVFLWNAKP